MKFQKSLVLCLISAFFILNSAASVADVHSKPGRTGTETFFQNATNHPLLPFIQSAKKSIDIEIYEMDDVIIQNALLTALKQGIQIRIVHEDKPVGASCRVFEPKSKTDSESCLNQKKLVQAVRKGGGQYVPFVDASLCGQLGTSCFEHGKMMIVDQKKVLLSTGNFNTSSLCIASENPTTCNRDYAVVSKDPQAVNLLLSIFEKDLAGQTYALDSILTHSDVSKVTVSPYSLSPLVHFIQSAKSEIYIQNQYLKDPDLNAAIMAAANRGVKVYVMVSSVCSFGIPSPSVATNWKATYTSFDHAGIKTRVFTQQILVNNTPGYLHAKAMVVDGTSAWVGSVNGSTMSLSNNREYGMFLNDPSEVQKLLTIMKQDFNDSNGETWQESLQCKKDTPPNGFTPKPTPAR